MPENRPSSHVFSRREFIKKTNATIATLPFIASPISDDGGSMSELVDGSAPVRWLDDQAPDAFGGVTWGMPWPQGMYSEETTFSLTSENGSAVPVQSWPLGYWPDGSLKWTAHAVPGDVERASTFVLAPGPAAEPTQHLSASETDDLIQVDTGVITATLAKKGDSIVKTIARGGITIAHDGQMICLLEDRSQPGLKQEKAFTGEIDAVTLEQSGPIRALVKIEGRHAHEDRAWLPFVVRLYFYAGSDAVRVVHTITFDGDEHNDFIAGLGLRFTVPMRGALHDRHVRFSGKEGGLFAESVRGLTGLRLDPGSDVRQAQIDGRATPPLSEWNQRVPPRLSYIPAFNDWTLDQTTADGFQIKKRTSKDHTWLMSAQGQRSDGFGFLGSPEGGLGFGLRNFWESYPAQLDIREAATDTAQVTLWLWAPHAQPMDLRPYHDGMGQDTYAKQYNGGLEINYEDYEPGFDTPYGVARTSEIFLWALAGTPSRDRLVALAAAVRNPPVLTTTPDYLHACKVFGDIWAPVNRSTPSHAAIEDRLDWLFDFYHDQREQRRWYGFWNYGDVMHTYDQDRHEWRYDVGGYAWDNSELSTDLWLWLYFLRTGRAEVFRFAEAMTRHTGEVDVHHIGRFAPLGSRHNVLHWGCSAKQLRISTALNRRYYYYLTADERVGDLMRAQVEAGRTLLEVPPGRKLAFAEEKGDLDRAQTASDTHVGLSVGTDWGSLAGAWLAEWERTGNVTMRDRLLASMRSLGQQPHGFFSTGLVMNLDTGAFDIVTHSNVGVSHLNAVFGLVEVCAELIQLLDVPEFESAWLQYCELYNAPAADQERVLGQSFRNNNLRQGHSRLTAYVARAKQDPQLAARAWEEFNHRRGRISTTAVLERVQISGPDVLRPVEEAPSVSTNGTAQYGLAAIQCMALVGEYA